MFRPVVEFRAPLAKGVTYLAKNLRQADVDEVVASGYDDTLEAINYSVRSSTHCAMVTINGTPVVWNATLEADDTAADFTASGVLTVIEAGWVEYILVGGGAGGAGAAVGVHRAVPVAGGRRERRRAAGPVHRGADVHHATVPFGHARTRLPGT